MKCGKCEYYPEKEDCFICKYAPANVITYGLTGRMVHRNTNACVSMEVIEQYKEIIKDWIKVADGWKKFTKEALRI
jgi:hypothetical protein